MARASSPSKLIVDKTPEQFAEVLETKSRRIASSLERAGRESAQVSLCLFSSTNARFGRSGQSDYAVANEALNKSAQWLFRRLPDCGSVSFNWGPWTEDVNGASAGYSTGRRAVIGLESGARF